MSLSKLSRRSFATALGAGLGAALLPRPLTPAARADAGPKGTILLNSNENPYGPSARAREAMTATQPIASRYPDSAEDDLRAALGRHHGVAPEQIVLGCGSGEVLKMADMAFLTAGRNVVVSQPTFEAVIEYARVTKAESVKVAQTSDFRHDLPKMAAACDARTGLVYVCNPNNPTGTIVSADEMGSFLDRVPKTATVLVDEAYHHFVEDPRYKSVVPSIAVRARSESMTSPQPEELLQPFCGALIRTSTPVAAMSTQIVPEAMQSSTNSPPTAFSTDDPLASAAARANSAIASQISRRSHTPEHHAIGVHGRVRGTMRGTFRAFSRRSKPTPKRSCSARQSSTRRFRRVASTVARSRGSWSGWPRSRSTSRIRCAVSAAFRSPPQ